MTYLSLIGKQYHDLTVIGHHGPRGGQLECRCVCGNIVIKLRALIVSGNNKSCGCRQKMRPDAYTTHGAKSYGVAKASYRSWQMMKNRCLSPTATDYKYYGARGIIISDRWLTYEGFIADMGEPAKGLTLERIDSNGNYEPTNCIWATRQQQARNRDYCKPFTWGARTMHSWEWAEVLHIKRTTFHVRLWRHHKDPHTYPLSSVFVVNNREK